MTRPRAPGAWVRVGLALALVAPTAAVLAATHVVTIERMSFGAMPEGVVAGDTIEWRNADVVPHTATAGDGSFDVVIAAGEKASVVIERAAQYEVSCTYHPSMTATLVVRRP